MTPALFHALAARIVLVAVCALVLVGIAVHTAANRPAPLDVRWTWTYEQPG